MSKFKSAGAMFLGLALAIGFATPGFASYTRILGMGQQNHNVEDGFNIWLNPAWIPTYSNVIIAELGSQANAGVPQAIADQSTGPTAGTQWGGFLHNWSPVGTWGVFIRRPYGLADGVSGNTYGASGIGGPTTRNDLIGTGNMFTAGGTGLRGVTTVGTEVFLDAGGFGFGDGTGISILAANGGTAPSGYTANFVAAGSNHAIAAPALTNRFDFFWGKKEFMSGMDLGVNVSWAAGQNNPSYTYASQTPQNGLDGTVTTDRTASELNIGAGIIYRSSGTFPRWEGAINLAMPSYKAVRTESTKVAAGNQTASSTYESDGNTGMNVFLRAQNVWEGQTMGLTTFRLASGNASGKLATKADTDADGATADNYDRSGTFKDAVSGWTIDHAINAWANQNLLIVVGAGVASSTVEQSTNYVDNATATVGTIQADSFKLERMSIPVSISAEHHTMDWLWTRFGVVKNVITTSKTTSSDADPTTPTAAATDPTRTAGLTTYTDAAATLNTGVSMKVAEGFGVDAMLRQGILFGGPYWISGVPNSMFGQLTAWYKF